MKCNTKSHCVYNQWYNGYRGIMVIDVGNAHEFKSRTSHFAFNIVLIFGKGMNPIILTPVIGK